MTVHYLKQARPAAASVDDDTTHTVRAMLKAVRDGGEERARAYAAQFDGWHEEAVVTPAMFARARASLSQGVRDVIRFARDRVQDFARRQRDSMLEFSTELLMVDFLREVSSFDVAIEIFWRFKGKGINPR